MINKINLKNIDKHILLLLWNNYNDSWNEIIIKFDDKEVATAYYSTDILKGYRILFLEKINLKKYKLNKQGLGKYIIQNLTDYFYKDDLSIPLLFLVQFDETNPSEGFYKHIGFKDFDKSKEFSKIEKDNIYLIIDGFCDDRNILFKLKN